MSIIARLKNMQGGVNPIPVKTAVTAAAKIKIEPNDSVISLNSASAVSTATTLVFVNASPIRPGRILTILNTNASDDITLKGTAIGSALENYVAGADITCAASKATQIMQIDSGAWVLVS